MKINIAYKFYIDYNFEEKNKCWIIWINYKKEEKKGKFFFGHLVSRCDKLSVIFHNLIQIK